MSSVNKVTIIGNLGDDPDVRTMQSGDKVVNLSIATSEKWKQKDTGEYKERTEWHRIVVFNKGLVNVCENYLKKGSKVYVSGKQSTNQYEGKYYTSLLVFNVEFLDSKSSIKNLFSLIALTP